MFHDLPVLDEFSTRVCIGTGLCLPEDPTGYFIRLDRVGGTGECPAPSPAVCNSCSPCGAHVVPSPAPAPSPDPSVSVRVPAVETTPDGKFCALLPEPITQRLKTGRYSVSLYKGNDFVAGCGWAHIEPRRIVIESVSTSQARACIEQCDAVVACTHPVTTPTTELPEGPEMRPLWTR